MRQIRKVKGKQNKDHKYEESDIKRNYNNVYMVVKTNIINNN